MTWQLYLDDVRNPNDQKSSWTIARSVAEAIALIKSQGCPILISFDHDLGDQVPSGLDLAKWLVESDLDGKIIISPEFRFRVHSANPPGAENIRALMRGYLSHKFG